MKIVAVIKREQLSIDDENPYLHPEIAEKVLPEEMVAWVTAPSSDSATEKVATHSRRKNLYECFLKPLIDIFLSFFGLLILSSVFLAITIAIKIDDPGPAFFTQKRVGKNKHFFALHKFRSMSMNTPHDTPTHMLANPEQYITRVGRFLRRSSLDEIPQIWDIFRGKMSIIGPRPALWNQADLIACRDRWGANGIMPGLTGLAQISGRDELEIEDKARLDGEYTQCLKTGRFMGAFLMDMKCFFGTVLPVLRSDGVVEGIRNKITTERLRREFDKKWQHIH